MSLDCLFCKIVSGEVPVRKVLETDDALAFLDIFPAAKGHTLIIPKKHAADIYEISSDLYGRVASTVQVLAGLVKEKLQCEGVTVLQSNREAAWQTVFHLHFHVVPRWQGDSLNKPWEVIPGDDAELDGVFSQLTK